jgi:hypothetical protein
MTACKHCGYPLEQHREVERLHRTQRVVVFSAVVLVTLALTLVGLVLWALVRGRP